MFVYMSGFRIQLMQFSQLSTNRVIALETYIPLNKDYWIFNTVDRKKNIYISKKDKYLKLANIPFGIAME